ncbi:MAG TPA: tetratricopeptide repeat protein [Anaerolineae bacterium]|nr:tetratricopeptide repeat protein [Anaerolineae bacterium]
MNTRLANPYVVGAPLSGSQGFYGREEVFRFVRETFAVPAQNVIVLYGQRRIGKTSLLHQLVARMGDEFHVVLFDFQGKGQHDLPALLYDLSTTIARSLTLRAPAPDFAAFNSDPNFFRQTFLPGLYAALASKRLLILFDEFDVIGDEPSSDDLAGNQLLEYLQKWLAQDPRVACVFVIGRRLDELPLHYRALFKQAVFRRLSVLPRHEAVDLIMRPADGVLDYTPGALEAILDLTAGHPYLTQLLCHVIYKRLIVADQHAVNADDVSACLDEAMEIGAGGLDWFWEGLPRAERIMLSALAETVGTRGSNRANGRAHPSASEEELLQTLSRHRVRLLGVELTSARQHLLEWEILARDGARYRFVVDLVRRWIGREHPLDRAQQDIDLISQRATRYFNNARDSHLTGDLALAIEDYRRALAANPQHFGARLGLAQSLHESNDLPAAIAEYEKAYQMDPSSARDGLVSARLALGVAHLARGDLNAAATEFERVLRIAPSDDEAQTRLIGIWIQRGEAELGEKRYMPAIDAFARALDITPDDAGLRTRIKSIMRRFSEAAEAQNTWEVAFESLARLAEYLSDDEQLKTWLNDTRARWRAHNYFEIAARARSAGDHLTTIEECRHALEANPNHVQARLLLAAVLYQTGDLSGAIGEYEQAYRLDPHSTSAGLAQALLQRAIALEAQGDLFAAVADYETALELLPGIDVARQRLPDIYLGWGDGHLSAGRLDDAVAAYRKALLVAAQPQTLARPIKAKLQGYSQAQRTAGNWDMAIAAITRLRADLMLRDRETDAWLVDVWIQPAEAALEAGYYQDAAVAFKQALQVAGDTGNAAAAVMRIKADFFAQVDARLLAEQPDGAITILQALIEVIGTDADATDRLIRAWTMRGELDLKHDRLGEAEQAFRQALELHPGNAEVRARLNTTAERRRQLEIERLRAEAAAHLARREWLEAQALYKQLVFDYRDEQSGQAFLNASEEIRLEELYTLARAHQAQHAWEAAIPVWLAICHSRGEYVGRDGHKAAVLLAEAIEHHAGIAQARRRTFEQLRQRARVAWLVVIGIAGVAAIVIFALASRLSQAP